MSRTTPIAAPGRTRIVGVLNLTPDSFSDGGRFERAGGGVDVPAVLKSAEAMLAGGADVLDLGGESTRPGAAPLGAADEIARVVPAIEVLAKRLDVSLSIDTRKAEVAAAALDAGAGIVNDVSGLGHDPALAGVVARHGAAIVLGHLRGEPATMQREVHFEDPLREVSAELAARVAQAEAAGIPRAQISVDPGIGFGKQLPHNLALLANLGALRATVGLPVWVGPSRKRFLGELTGEPDPRRRDVATHAACAVAVFAGADAVRVHDVAGARDAVRVAEALRDARRDGGAP